MSNVFTKDPDAVLDWEVDWADWLADTEVITVAIWIVQDGLTKDSNSATDTAATIWLSGGTVGEIYLVTSRITTNAGRTDDRSMKIRVVER